MLWAYIDGSGTHRGSPVVSFSGFAAPQRNWLDFDAAWNSVLDSRTWPSRLSRFHAFHCAHGEGEFFEGRWTFAERLALFGELADVIKGHHLRPISYSALAKPFEMLPPEDLGLLRSEDTNLSTPLQVAFQGVTQELLGCAREYGPGVAIKVVFDQDDPPREENFVQFAAQYMATFHLGDAFDSFGFGDSRQIAALQAADLLAYTTHQLAQRSAGLDGGSLTEFPAMRVVWNMLVDLAEHPYTSPVGVVCDGETLRDLVRKVKNNETLPKKVVPNLVYRGPAQARVGR